MNRAVAVGAAVGSVVWLAVGIGVAQDDLVTPPELPDGERIEMHEREPFDGRDRDPFGWYVPDFARLQTGGFQGQINIGIGYAFFDDIVNWKVGYGYVAPGNDSDESIHTIDTSVSIRPFEVGRGRVRWIPVFLGVGVLYAPGDEYELILPRRYAHLSDSYYEPTALRFTSHIGMEVAYRPEDGGFIERHALFYQAVLMDRLGQAYFENREQVKLTDAFASALGYRMAW